MKKKPKKQPKPKRDPSSFVEVMKQQGYNFEKIQRSPELPDEGKKPEV